MACHAGVAENEIYMRGDRVHGLELQADIVGALAGLLLESSDNVGQEMEATMLELIA